MNDHQPSELISIDDALSKENEFQIQLELAPEEPKTEEENTLKLNNLIKHMEFNIQQNRKRCENLSKDCFDILQSTELLAFDFLFADYLLGFTDSQTIYSFFEQCIHPSFDLSTGKDSDFEKASEHINYLQDIIKRTSQSLLENELKPVDIPKRTSEFILYLTDQKTKLDREISRYHIRSQIGSQPPSEEDKDTIFQIEENEPDTSDLPRSFTDFLTSEFDFFQKETEDQNSNSENITIVERNSSDNREKKDSTEINVMITSIAHRLSQIEEIKNKIQQLKKNDIDPSNIDSGSCNPSDIESSPFFVGLKNNCQLLLSAFNSMKSQETFIPICFNALERCRSQLLQLSTSLDKSIDAMQGKINKMRDSIASRQDLIADRVKKLRPFIDSIFMKNALPSISSTDQNSNEYDLIKGNLENDLKSIEVFEEMSQKEAMMARKNVHKNIDMLDEIKLKREELIQLFEQMNKIITLIEEKDASILSLVMNFCKADVEIELHKEEFHLLSTYEEGLKEVLKSLKFNEIGEWCDKLGEIGQTFYQAAKDQQEVIDKLQDMTENDNIEDKIAKKKEEIEELSTENYKLCDQLEKEKLKLDEVIQERIEAQERINEKINDEDWIPDYIDRNDEESVRRFKEMVICPTCQQNRRDSILSSCGHPLCRACIQRANGKCPICSVPFTEDNIKPFFIQ